MVAVLQQDPHIVLAAFLGTVAIFASFSAAALTARRRTYLYLGGILYSCLSSLFVMGLLNVFLRLELVFLVSVYGGLVLFVAYVVYDTQGAPCAAAPAPTAALTPRPAVMLEKAHQGSRDYVRHALELFVDFVAIFIRLLIILSRRK